MAAPSELRDGEDVAAVEVASISAAVPAPRSDGPFNGAASGVAESCQSVSLNARQGVGTHTFDATAEPLASAAECKPCCFGKFETMQRAQASFLFDLDGTLVDTVYQHVLAWQEALETEGIKLSVWRIHRRIGMSGGLLTNMLLRETGLEIDSHRMERLQRLHAQAYNRRSANIQPLPGARELLAYLTQAKISWAIATSGRMETARPVLETLGVDFGRVTIVTRDQVKYAKPDPDVFLTAAERLGIAIETASVVGDSVWDMLAARRAWALGIGVLSGGYGQEELERAGAYRVYEDPADLLRHIDEVGGRR